MPALEQSAFRSALQVVATAEPRVARLIAAELASQRRQLKLIASENYASPAVLLAMGNWLSDKYAEGTPGRRMYAGCEQVDEVERIAAEHAVALFGADHAYVQPHSGIDANLVAFWAVLTRRLEQPFLEGHGARHVNDLPEQAWQELRRLLGDQRMLGMSLDAGGHLTHGFRPNISGKMFHQASYGVDPGTGLIDYDALRCQARSFRPLILLAGYSAYPRNPNFAVLRELADEVGATLMVDMAHFAGLVAGKVLTGDLDPVPHAHIVTTTTHKSLRGPRGGMVLASAEYAEFVDRGCPMVLGGPLPHVMAAKAVALAEARRPEFADYAAAIVTNARALAEGLARRGAKLVTGGTDNHIVLVDVAESFGLTGRQAEAALLECGVVSNRNSVPGDRHGPWYTSGVRLGTPALTTLGLGVAEMDEVAAIITGALGATQASGTSRAHYSLDGQVAAACRERCADILSRFPLYPGVEL
ncbi:MAG TPA: glycine hydroxymethyltransferase [Acidimicrobiales bacterium]|nr:glycine hydroxymethyltransferase [Acidimicrobiales bacterium]